MRGGRISVQQVATDAFGNALGSSLASGSFSGTGQNEAVLQGAGPWSGRDYVNGMDLQSDNYNRPSTGGAGWSGTGLRLPNGSGQPGLYNTPAAMGAFNDGYDIARGERLLTEARDRDIDLMAAQARAETQASRNANRAQASSSKSEYDKALNQLSALSQGPVDRLGAASGPVRIQTAGNFATRGVPSLDEMTLSPTASSLGSANSTFSLNGSGSGARPIDMLVDTAKAAYNDPLRAAKNVFLGVAQGGIGFVGDAVKGYAMMGDLAFNGGQNIGAIDRFSVRPFAYDADMGLLGVAGELASPAAYVKLAQLGGQGLRVGAPVAQEMWATAGERLMAPRTMNTQFGGVLVGDGVGASSAKVAPDGVVYLRTDRTGGLEPYGGQAKSEARFIERQKEHARANPNADFEYSIVGRAQPGVALDIAEHNSIQQLTGGVAARQSPLVSNSKDPMGAARRTQFGLPEPKR